MTEGAMATALIKDLKHVKWSQRLPTQSLKRQMLPSLVVGQTRLTSGSESTRQNRTGPTTVKCGLGPKHDQKDLG